MSDTLTIMNEIGDSNTKTLVFETTLEDKEANLLGIRVTEEDGEAVNKLIEHNALGNAVAEAMDILTGTILPIGTKFRVNIEVLKRPDTLIIDASGSMR